MPHADRKKKAGERKDKKTARMREDIQRRRENVGTAGPESDQPDLMNYKPGSRGDRNQDPSEKNRRSPLPNKPVH